MKSNKMQLNLQHVGMSLSEYETKFCTPEEQRAIELKSNLILNMIEVRKKAKLSQRKLEELSGIRQPTIAKIERGNMNPSLDVVLKLLAVMGKTLKIASL